MERGFFEARGASEYRYPRQDFAGATPLLSPFRADMTLRWQQVVGCLSHPEKDLLGAGDQPGAAVGVPDLALRPSSSNISLLVGHFHNLPTRTQALSLFTTMRGALRWPSADQPYHLSRDRHAHRMIVGSLYRH